MSFDLSDYVDVAERIREFAAKYPEGSLQSELTHLGAGWLCKAYAYRTPTDERPGVGHAFEPVPGKTPYTKDSEAMNAETSAWGRAIVALGFETKKIASAEEVRNRQVAPRGSTSGAPTGGPAQPSPPAPSGGYTLPFGKHKGKTLPQVGAEDTAYLSWVATQMDAKSPTAQGAVEKVRAFLAGDDGIPFG